MPGAPRPQEPHLRDNLKTAARKMRNEPTPAEDYLWQHLRNRQMTGSKFRRQQSIERFIVDFYCAEAHLIIEVDGSIHNQPNSDAERQSMLETLGLRVIRFSNDEVFRSLDDVLEQIRAALAPTE